MQVHVMESKTGREMSYNSIGFAVDCQNTPSREQRLFILTLVCGQPGCCTTCTCGMWLACHLPSYDLGGQHTLLLRPWPISYPCRALKGIGIAYSATSNCVKSACFRPI